MIKWLFLDALPGKQIFGPKTWENPSNGEVYYDNKYTDLSFFPYTGWHNNVYYNSGINLDSYSN